MYALVLPSYRCFISNLALIGQAVSEKIFEYYGDIHVYCPGVGPLVQFFRIIHLEIHFSLQMTVRQFSPFKCMGHLC